MKSALTCKRAMRESDKGYSRVSSRFRTWDLKGWLINLDLTRERTPNISPGGLCE